MIKVTFSLFDKNFCYFCRRKYPRVPQDSGELTVFLLGRQKDVNVWRLELKAKVYNPGELASELENGTSSKSPRQCTVQSHTPTNLNVHLAVGLSREKEMREHNAAIQLNLAWSRQEVQCQNNQQHPVTFQNKTLRGDTSTRREVSCLPYCAVVDSNRNRWGLPEGEAKPVRSRNAADPFPAKTWLTH